MKTVKRLSRRSREIFLDGLRRYQDKGVRILVDGKDAMPEDMERLLIEYEDGSFYMGDYIWEENSYGAARPRETGARDPRSGPALPRCYAPGLARESQAAYTAGPEAQAVCTAGSLESREVRAAGSPEPREVHAAGSPELWEVCAAKPKPQAADAAAGSQPGAVTADNLKGKRLKEIHFDRVYYR